MREVIVLKETTKWNGNTPNHTYHICKKSGKLLSYVSAITGEHIVLKKHLSFSRSKRTFKQIGKYTLDS